ncbi:MAG: hypothetical protein ACLFVJ_22840 [Persicimonas sp.]
MSRGKKIFLAVLTAWPLVYVFIFMAFVFGTMFLAPGAGEQEAGVFLSAFGAIFVAHGLTMLLQFGLLFYFLYHLFKKSGLEGNTQLLWALLIFIGGPIGQLIYWWKEIWAEEQQAEPAAAAPGFEQRSQPGGHDGQL